MLHWALARDHLVSWAFYWPGSKLNILKYKSFRLHLFWGVLFLNIHFGPSKIVYHWPERPLTFKTWFKSPKQGRETETDHETGGAKNRTATPSKNPKLQTPKKATPKKTTPKKTVPKRRAAKSNNRCVLFSRNIFILVDFNFNGCRSVQRLVNTFW